VPYTPTTYTTTVTAANLNKGETAIQSAQAGVDTLTATVPLKANLWLNVKDYGAVGDGTNDDTSAIVSALAALPSSGNTVGGTVFFPPGVYKVTSQIALGYNQQLVGSGKGEFLQAYGSTTIKSTLNGQAIVVLGNRYGWSIRDLAITGDRTLASQDLLTIGAADNLNPSVQGTLERIYVSQAGRDNLVLADALHVHAVGSYFHMAKRYNLRTTGQSNSNKFTKCNFREADQWGVYVGAGYGIVLDCCTIESNNRDATGAYGGLWVDPNSADAAASISLLMLGCHFEENSKTTGKPIQVSTGTRGCTVTEIDSLYTETDSTRQVTIASGEWTSINVHSNLTTHAAVTSTRPVMFVNPRKEGAGNFLITDSQRNTIVVGATTTTGAAGSEIRIANDTMIYSGGAAVVRTRGQWSVQRANATDVAFGSLTDPDGVERHLVHASGKHFWGNGSTLDVSLERTAANRLELQTADFAILTPGRGLRIGEGTNAKMGRSTLVAGTVTVSTTAVTAASEIFLTCQTPGGTPGFLRVSARTAGTSFTILSSSNTDTSVVAWMIVEPA
jgi:hypothetical protein